VFEYNPTAQRYEPGTRDATKALGVAASVAFLEQIGMQRIADYGQGLARYLQDQLRQIDGMTVLTPEDPALSASITTFKTSTVPYDELYRFFAQEFQLRCRIVTERGLDALRVSTHIFNNKADCDRVVEATRAVLKTNE
jgi:cysteine desulfurase/selenocysteine lyase